MSFFLTFSLELGAMSSAILVASSVPTLKQKIGPTFPPIALYSSCLT